MRRIVLGFSTLCLVLAAVLGAYLAIDPVGFRRHVFQPVRELRLLHQELHIFRNWSDLRRVVLPASEVVKLEVVELDRVGPEEPLLVADLHRPKDGTSQAPAMLVLHGSAPCGRKSGLVRLLGAELAQRGWVVLAPDARGFGDSGIPADTLGIGAWDVSGDVRRGLDYLASLPGVDAGRVYVLGHSMGANHALEGALGNPQARGMILVGPSRFDLGESSALQQWWWRVRFAADRKLSRPLETEAMQFVLGNSHLPRFLSNGLAKRGEQRVLFVDGALEGEWNLNYLDQFVARVSPPVKRVTLSDTGHYCGVWSYRCGNTLWYRPDLFEPFMALIIDFAASDA